MASTFTSLSYHVVFSTKGRKPLIAESWSDDLYAYMGGIARAEGGMMRCAGGIEDHVHLLLDCKASVPLSHMVGRVKAASSKWVNSHGRVAERFDWQRGYSAFSVSMSGIAGVRDYIKAQRQHHATTDLREELIAFLKAHRVEYDERYLLG